MTQEKLDLRGFRVWHERLAPFLPDQHEALSSQTDALWRHLEPHVEHDSEALHRSVCAHFDPSLDASLGRRLPSRQPLYWILPALLALEAGVERERVAADVERFSVAGAVHSMADDPRIELGSPCVLEALIRIRAGYQRCSAAALATSADLAERIDAKCEPWKSVVAFGTRDLRAAVAPDAAKSARLGAALSAVMAVFSCLQTVDDYHDGAEDERRGSWNLWTSTRPAAARALCLVLTAAAVVHATGLPEGVLRQVLALQLRDTLTEVRVMLEASIAT